MKKDTYIVLYAEEFKEDVWMSYMEILGLSYSETEVTIVIKNIIT